MVEILRRMVWFGIVSSALSYAVFLVLGNFVMAQASDEGPVEVRDVLAPGSHQLSGMVNVERSCDELLVRTQQISTSTYHLLFTTWENPSVDCTQGQVPRFFKAALFAPSAGVVFTATLDGRPFPILVVPDIAASTVRS